jgi:hypothetical protein
MVGPGTVITPKLIRGHRTVKTFRAHRLGRVHNSHKFRGKHSLFLLTQAMYKNNTDYEYEIVAM